MNDILWLQSWFEKNCDGDWEHDWRVRIENLDNPGWLVKINFEGMIYQNMTFDKIEVERSETDWMHCFMRDKTFTGAGGFSNLIEIIGVLHKWIEKYDASFESQ